MTASPRSPQSSPTGAAPATAGMPIVFLVLGFALILLSACGGGAAGRAEKAATSAVITRSTPPPEQPQGAVAPKPPTAVSATRAIASASGPTAGAPTPGPGASGGAHDEIDPALAASGFKTGGCGACHVIPGVANATGTIGPDLSRLGDRAGEIVRRSDYAGQAASAEEYIREAIVAPEAFISDACPGGSCQKGLMAASLAQALSDQELDAVVGYLKALPASGETMVLPAPVVEEAPGIAHGSLLSDGEFAEAKEVFFQRCAGCHGTLRKGATGPALTPDKTEPKGTAALASIIFNGTPRGMPDWGKQGVLTQAQTEIMAKYLLIEPPAPPEMSLPEMLASWEVVIPVEERPAAPEHDRDWQNFMAVTLRDAGQVAIIDGDTFEVVNKVNTGYAVHISRMSKTGRYIYTIGRDGKLVLIDSWMKVPDVVAEVKVCHDARSVEVSKYAGAEGDFSDKYAVVGCYWPPHFVILDGLTLEPFKIVSTRGYTYDTEEYHPEPRVASIVASEFKPEWIINVKETGQVWLVNYTDPSAPAIKMIEAERFLHDGGWDATHRYFLVAANQANKVAVIDALEGKLEAIVETSKIPHPGRGANWVDPEYGPVWSTSHLGDASLVAIGTDPEGYPDSAWKVVREIALPGAGSLFVKTHPNSPWVWTDHTLATDEEVQRTVCVIAKADPTKTHKCWKVSDYGRITHFEYNKDGTQIWVSVWGRADEPGKVGEIVVYDDRSLEEVARIPDLVTPTGKFNVYNTVHDVY